MASQVVSAEKRYRMSLLLDTYGELLTEKQRTFLRRYYEEDLSFGEIARESGVSRQAIFDSVKHGEASLENYEGVLGLVKGSSGAPKAAIHEIRSPKTPPRAPACAARLRTLAEAIATSSVDADVTWITRELESIAAELESCTAAPALDSEADDREDRETAISSRPAGKRPALLRGDGPEVD